MFKHTFITLTVSLLVVGLLSVFQPQPEAITEQTNQPEVALSLQAEPTQLKEDKLILNMENIERKVTVKEPVVEEKEEEAQPEEKTEEKTETKTVAKVETKTVAKVVAKVETKKVEQPVTAEVKADTQEEPKEEVKAETTEEPKEEVKPAPVASKVSSTPAATWELEIARLTNIEREKAGLSILKYNTSLEVGAMIRANEIVDNFSHTRPDGSRFFTAFGNLQYKNIGENLASGFRTPEAAMSAWMGSDSHRANILKPEYEEISVAIVQGADGKYRWVQIFYRG
jgi:uncharacterized protein YkwD